MCTLNSAFQETRTHVALVKGGHVCILKLRCLEVKITGPTCISLMCLPAHVYAPFLYPCAEICNTAIFLSSPIQSTHPVPAVSDMELLIWRKKRERDSKRGQLHSRGQGSDWETVRDPVEWWQEHSRQILNQQRR